MCMSCGCHLPNADHGDSRHITLTELMDAGKASGISVEQVAENITETLAHVTGDADSGNGEVPG